ncbi:MAG: nitroreductase family protein [Candidatus Anstonellaceae archaeon]
MKLDFFEAVQRRVSVREFLPKEIGEENLHKILSAVMLAPSAGNLQAFRVVLVKDAKLKEKIAAASFEQDFISQAPLVLVFLADRKRSQAKYGTRGASLYCIQDATIAAAYCQLAATALGLGSVWVGAFEEETIALLVRAKPHEIPVAVLPIGYPACQQERPPRPNLAQKIAYVP